MKAKDLEIKKLLRFIPSEGLIKLGDARVLLVETSSLGVLRKAVIDAVGQDMARRIFYRFGFSCGQEDAASTRKRYRWDSDKEWLLAGPRLHALMGNAAVEPLTLKLEKAGSAFRMAARWTNSYEAHEHWRFFGVSTEPVCWALSGYASGWATAFLGRPVVCLESVCAGMGHDYCLPELRPAEEWGPEVEALLADLSEVERIQPKSLLEREAGRARESEQKYRQLFDSAADMIFLREPEQGTLIDVNPRAALQLGYKREELVSHSYFDLLGSPEEVTETRRMFAQALEGGPATRVSVFRRKDGQSMEAEVRNTPMRVGDNILILGIARDLTAQRLLERRALAFYQAFLNSNDFMFHTDRNGVIQDVNDAFVRRFGYSREEAIGRSPRLVRSRHSDQRLYEGLWNDILDPSRGFWRGRIVNRTKSGEEIPVLLSITTVRDSRGEIVGFVSSGVDISEVEELHQRLTRSESLAAVGSMAAVVAHEIRNPLGSIVTAASSLTRESIPAEEKRTLLSVLRKESLRLSETLRHFLQYARPREPKLEKADLNETVREVLSMVKADPQVLGSIKVGERFDAELAQFPFDADQLRQVIWNVVLNALQAMGGRGRLEVSTESRRPLEEGEGRPLSAQGLQAMAAVHVQDDGPGITPEALSRIFQPFHTTKRQGTGLGLPIAERIVLAHGGRILVDSVPGKGARFSILLPMVRRNPGERGAP